MNIGKLFKFKFQINNKEQFFNIYLQEPILFESNDQIKNSHQVTLLNCNTKDILLKLGEKKLSFKNKKSVTFYKFLSFTGIIWINKNSVELY